MKALDALRELLPRGGYKREVAGSFATNVLLAGLQFISGMMLARFLGVEGRGELAAIQALPTIIGTFGMLGLQDAVIYFGARDERRIGDYAVSGTVLIVLLGVPIVAVAAALTPWFLSGHAPATIRGGQFFCGLLFVHGATSLSITAARAAHDIALWNRLRVVPTVLWVLVIAAMKISGTLDARGLAEVYLVSFFVWCGIAIWPARRHFRSGHRLRPSLWPPMLRYGLPVAFGGTPRILNQRIDQVIIAGMFAAEDLGLYAAAVAWATLMQLPATAMTAVAFSKIAKTETGAAQRGFARKAILTLAVVSVVAAAALGAMAPIGIPLIFGAPFAGAVPLAVVLGVAAGLRNVVQMAQNLLMGAGRPGVVFQSEWTGFITLLVLLSVLVPPFGLQGVAYSVVVANVAALGIALRMYSRWARSV